MADDDFGDEYGDYFFDDDYLYIEDEYAIADELAEGQVPSPGYSGTNAELAAESFEWDNYDFWSDLAYGSDSYFDPESKTHRKRKDAKDGVGANGHKRKRASISTSITKDKRRRVTIEQRKPGPKPLPSGVDNVLFRADQPPIVAPPTPQSMESFALLPDWKERFPADSEINWKSTMPEDMKKAAEADGEVGDDVEPHDSLQDEDISNTVSPAPKKEIAVKSRKHKAKRMAHHSVDDADEPESGDMSSLLSSLDPDTLRSILRQKLGNTGLNEAAFMTVIQDMLAGNAADDAAEQLTKMLLQGDSPDKEATLSWLGGRGVNVTAGAEDSGDDDDVDSGRRVDSGSGLPVDDSANGKSAAPQQSTAATPQRKRKPRADPGMSSVEGSPATERRSATSTATRSSRKKTKS